jgi:hypothetical protein
MGMEVVSDNQRIEKMSFKDLTARAAAAIEPRPLETDKILPETEAPKEGAKEPAPKSETT